MQILFVSSIHAGGSALSQRQLARRLAVRGHRVEILGATQRSRVVRPLYEHQVDLSTKLRGSRVEPALLALERPMGRRLHRLDTSDHPTWVAVVPENGYRSLRRRFRPDVVVGSSIDRVSWRRIRAQLAEEGIPSVLYVREASGLGHLSPGGPVADLLLANAQSHVEGARALGYEATLVPSVVELDRSRAASTREVVLLVNPIPILGGDRVWALAAARPDIPFVLQESGLMSEDERAAVLARLPAHPNVSVRPYATEPGALFRDARLLLVPHRVDNRPRVVLEAQANGIPVLASEHPGLAESVGPGGLLVADTDDAEAWLPALAQLWDDPERYAELSRLARAHASRPEVSPERIVDAFEAQLRPLVGNPRRPATPR
jgi:glycosyltransferase involved in cell wall biosynthesis